VSEQRQINRRSLLKASATGLAAASTILAGCSQGHQEPFQGSARRGRVSPNERVTLGFIGTGDLGRRHHMGVLLGHEGIKERVDIAAVCDVDANRVSEAARMCMERANRRVGVYEDYRRLLDRNDLDAVFVVTPDHWHTLVALAAIEAGKDIYCEKPLTLTVNDGKALVAAARRYGTVFQTGSQQRSDGRFRKACELVRNGKIGRIKRVDTVLHAVGPGEWKPAETPPAHLNWNFWLGPAPYVDYRPNCVHYQFRWLYDYSGGVMTDWGAHHNDIAQWALGMDGSGPVEVDGTEATFHEHGPYNVPARFDVRYRYANGVELVCHTNDQSCDDGTKFGNGVKFTGENGWIVVSRGDLQASDPDILKIELGANDVRLYHSENHHKNFLDCIQTRDRCICDVEIGHRSVSVCHIGNISMRLGRALRWDPAREQFVDDETANRMLSRSMRAPWHL